MAAGSATRCGVLATLAAALLLHVVVVKAASSGSVASCDPYDNFGCSQWRRGDRLDCTDPNAGHMEWVARPVRTDNYTLRTADTKTPKSDPKTYTPGRLLHLYLRVNQYDWKYRGLLLRAVDSNGTVVGSWSFPNEEDNLFWSPPQCPQALLHNAADIKPFLSVLTYRAPPAGTGRITFQCLIKRGPANEGYFYHPNLNGDLSLSEAPSRAEPNWVAGNEGESCDAVCRRVGQRFGLEDMQVAESSSGQTAFLNSVARHHECRQPILRDCSAASPLADSKGNCWYHGSDCGTETTHSAQLQGFKRFCVCGSGLGTGTGTGTGRRRVRRESLFSTTSAGGRPARASWSAVWLLCVFVPVLSAVMGGTGRSGFSRPTFALFVLALLAVMALMAGSARAHNWMHTPSRSLLEASTEKPCRARKSSDTHAQVGPGQEFVLKWATGHGRPAYFVVLHEKDEDWLRHKDFIKFVEDYIDLAPEGANVALEPGKQRMHGNRGGSQTFYETHPMFDGSVSPNSPDFMDHPFAQTKMLYRYTKETLQGDARVAYRSDKYPWIEAAMKYPIVEHLPADYDAIKLSIPAAAGPGKYTVHWRWSGYYDCIDVDVFDAPVEHVNGLLSSESSFVWNRMDHCQYMEPREVTSQCRVAPADGVQQCAADAPLRANDRLGVNVVPAYNPAGTFDVAPNIPWGNSNCANTALTLFEGDKMMQATNWAAWEAQTTTQTGVDCTQGLWWARLTLRSAVLRCEETNCAGLAWQRPADGDNGEAPSVYEGEHNFRGCRSTQTRDSAQFTTFFKAIPEPAPLTAAATAPTLRVSFQPADATVTLPDGWVADTGAMFDATATNNNGAPRFGWFGCSPRFLVADRGDGAEPTTESTHVFQLHNACQETGRPPVWEAVVPNGVYSVRMGTNIRPRNQILGSCNLENTHLEVSNAATLPTDARYPDEVTTVVEVTDGRLTLTGEALQASPSSCQGIATLEAEHIATAFPSSWLPPAANPWWQQRIDETQGVGLVTVRLPTGSNLRSKWFYKGHTAVNNQGLGPVSVDKDQGAVVALSNRPCRDNQCWPSTICKTLDTIRTTGTNRQLTDLDLDCGGAKGKYLYVQLPGSQRILDLVDVQVNVQRPKLSKDAYVCYSVEARPQTETTPEYVISNDPEDPVFYSTCYVRERNITWLPTSNKIQVPLKRWRFNGQCLDCSVFEDSLLPTNETFMDYIKWRTDPQCNDCAGTINAAAVTVDPQASSGGGGGGNTAGIAVGVVFALLIALVAVLFVVRRRNANAQRRYKTPPVKALAGSSAGDDKHQLVSPYTVDQYTPESEVLESKPVRPHPPAALVSREQLAARGAPARPRPPPTRPAPPQQLATATAVRAAPPTRPAAPFVAQPVASQEKQQPWPGQPPARPARAPVPQSPQSQPQPQPRTQPDAFETAEWNQPPQPAARPQPQPQPAARPRPQPAARPEPAVQPEARPRPELKPKPVLSSAAGSRPDIKPKQKPAARPAPTPAARPVPVPQPRGLWSQSQWDANSSEA